MIAVIPLPGWILMWTLALAVYGTCKCLTLAVARPSVPATRKVAYLLLWPGMNAPSFLLRAKPIIAPLPMQYLRPLFNILAGSVILWIVARQIPAPHPLLAAWVGMIGLIMLLHFGLLEIPSLLFRAAGFDAPPLMNRPLRSTTVSEFWSTRWNTAFRQLAHQFIFRPVLRRCNILTATLATFFVSGLIHDLIISLPAHGGYGLPTAYFMLQGLALIFERSAPGRRLLRGPLARTYTIAAVALPAPLLFHPPFIHNVILPFMVALRALPQEFLT